MKSSAVRLVSSIAAITLALTVSAQADQGLRHGQATRSHGLACGFAHFVTIGRRGSLFCHVPRTHA